MLSATYKANVESDPAAQVEGAMLLYSRKGGDVDKDRAITLLREAAKANNAWGQFNYGMHLEREKKFTEARQYYKKATAQGLVIAKVQLAGMLADGCGGEKEVERALCLFREAANMGNADAQFSAAAMLWEAEDGDLVEAVMWYKKAAESGHLRAMNNYATLLLNGHGVEKDPKQALEFYRKSAEGGNVEAQFNLGDIYEMGREKVPIDLAKAKIWYQKAADQNDMDAVERLKKLKISFNLI